jgi:ATP phosphoribosyltransferase regulatory subunit HisZ
MNGMSAHAGDIMRTVDKLDKIGPEKVRELLINEVGMFTQKADTVLDFMAISGTNSEVIAGLERFSGMDETFDEGLAELKTVVKYLADFGVPEENFAIDLTIARGLDYYTGTVYETLITDHPEIGSVCSGGRYDDLAEYYTDKKLPGCWHIHRSHQAVLRSQRAGHALRRRCVIALRRAGDTHDGGSVLRHFRRHRSAGRGRPHPALHGTEKVQGTHEPTPTR